MSDTPRTNAIQQGIDRRANLRGFVVPEDVFDMADLARQLEADLAAANAKLAVLERENVALGLKLDTARMAVDELKKREARWITNFRKDANTLADIADRLWTELDRVEPENG